MLTTIFDYIVSGIDFLLESFQNLLTWVIPADIFNAEYVFTTFESTGSPFFSALVLVNAFVDLSAIGLILSITVTAWWSGSFIIRRMRKATN